MPDQVVSEILEHTGHVAFRYRLWPTRSCEYIGEAALDLFGYSASDLYADPSLPDKIVYPDDRHLMRMPLKAPHGQEVELEVRWVRPDGAIVFTEIRCAIVRDPDGHAILCDGVVRDVTQRAMERQRLELIEARGRDPESARAPVVRVVIVDDEYLIRAGLRLLLADDPGLEVVGEAHNGHESVAMVTSLHPDIVLMDVRMPDMDGIEVTRELKRTNPMTCVLMLTAFEDVQLLIDGVRAGAAGYILKTLSGDKLRSAIWQAMRGELPIDSQIMRLVLTRLADERQPTSVPAWDDPLSQREREVLQLLVRGKSNREIADELIVSNHTIKVHVEHILAKFHVSDRTQAAVRAIELGYVKAGAR